MQKIHKTSEILALIQRKCKHFYKSVIIITTIDRIDHFFILKGIENLLGLCYDESPKTSTLPGVPYSMYADPLTPHMLKLPADA